MKLEDRIYQDKAVDYAMGHGIDEKIIHCAPTGSGKTIMQAKICKREMDRGDRTAILTPRNEIFDQTHSLTSGICGYSNIAVLRAKRRDETWNPMAPVHVCSWPTMIARAKRSNFFFPDVKRVQVDECHLSVAPKILEILEHYAPKAVIDGWTATPGRQTGYGLGKFFTAIKHVTTVRQLIKEGYLCPIEYWGGSTPDLKGIKIKRGDYEVKKLSDACITLVGDAVDNWLRLAADRHTIVFAVDIAHCEMLTHKFQEVGVNAAALHTGLDEDERDEVNRLFKSQAIQVLVNVGIATYGYDAPSVNCIQLCRPTKSIVMHLQMIGRGMRPGIDAEGNRITDPNDPDFKVCMVLDHAGNVPAIGQANDLFRWRLDEGKKACENWSRNSNSGEATESTLYECNDCHRQFSGSRVCPECGWKVPFRKKDIATVDANLVPIGKRMIEKLPEGWPTHENFYRMLIRYGAEKGYKPGFAKVKFKEKCDIWPPSHWTNMASLPVDKRVKNWLLSRQIANAKRREKAT